jgi:hypothetical protein
VQGGGHLWANPSDRLPPAVGRGAVHPERRDAAADGVDDERADLLDGRGIDVLEVQAVRIGGEPLGERRLRPGGARGPMAGGPQPPEVPPAS